ncbi:MAG: RpiB/LacA/LacB family sugar-phosphate isomerase [Patescibacteria group bacterium]|nr:RpiB/LacA/LacB family sugar-phosphate isomerase [Patescibacteria group bacterium]
MLIYLGADHRGFRLKESVKKYLKDQAYEVVDVGNTELVQTDDYPDPAAIAARKVSMDPNSSRAILICGSGVGMDMVANKFPHVRSVLALNPDQVASSRNDDNTNVLSLAADYTDEEHAKQFVSVWLDTPFAGEERHKRRLLKVDDIENRRSL